jgi:hypothetical protein
LLQIARRLLVATLLRVEVEHEGGGCEEVITLDLGDGLLLLMMDDCFDAHTLS